MAYAARRRSIPPYNDRFSGAADRILLAPTTGPRRPALGLTAAMAHPNVAFPAPLTSSRASNAGLIAGAGYRSSLVTVTPLVSQHRRPAICRYQKKVYMVPQL